MTAQDRFPWDKAARMMVEWGGSAGLSGIGSDHPPQEPSGKRWLSDCGDAGIRHHHLSRRNWASRVDSATGFDLQSERVHAITPVCRHRGVHGAGGDWNQSTWWQDGQQGGGKHVRSTLDHTVSSSGPGDAVRPVDNHIKGQLTRHLNGMGTKLQADLVAIVSPIVPGLELRLRHAIETLTCKQEAVAVILDTPGGVVEVVERMVTAIRSVYEEVTVIVPDRAMSAGTILALSADRIMMDHLS